MVTELILFAGILGGLFDALAWLLDPNNWWVILQVALGLGFVIFVHELGHFLVAKACGVKCEKFYIGFDIGGMKLFKRQWGETEYGIGILPLGGYVKMLGQDDNPYRAAEEMKRARATESALANGGSESHHHLPGGDLPPEPTAEPHLPYDPRSYMAQSVPERMAIISAGVVMNVIFAFVMATVAYLIGVKELPCRISQVFAGGAAWEADLQSGDEIVQIKDLKDPNYDDLRLRVPLSDLQEGVEFTIRREGLDQPFTVTLHPKSDLGIPVIGVDGPRKLELGSIPYERFSPSARANPALLPGDQIKSVNGDSITSVKDWQRALLRHAKEPLEIVVQSGRKDHPAASDDDDAMGKTSVEVTPRSITVPVSPRRDLGLIMEMGPVLAVQNKSPAAIAGIEVNDRLIAIDGEPVGDPMTLPDRLAARGDSEDTVTLRVKRGDKEIDLAVRLRPVTWIEEIRLLGHMSVPALGIAYDVLANVEAVEANSPAAQAGLKQGDTVTAAELVIPNALLKGNPDLRQPSPAELAGNKADNWPIVMDALQSHHSRGTVRLTYSRSDQQHTVEMDYAESKEFFNADRGMVLALDYHKREENLVGAAKLGLHKTVDSLLMVYRFLQRLTQKQISPKLLGGPVTIAKVAGQSAEEGFPALLMFLTMLSANLAVVNFLPIPVLDGGHMVFLIYEGITGKPPSERVFVLLSYLGLAFILVLMLFVLGLDFGFISRR